MSKSEDKDKKNKGIQKIINEKKTKIVKKIKKNLSNISKKLKIKQQKFNTLELLLLVIIAFVFGVFVSEAFVFEQTVRPNGSVSIQSITSNNEIEKVYNTIMDSYYEEIDEQGLKESAINGMINYLGDNYSLYFNQEEKNNFEEELNGKYLGAGLKITKYENQYPMITEVFDNTPASEAGLKPGDFVTKIEGEDIFEKTLDSVVASIKGELNKKVKITIKREEKEMEKEISTKLIDIPSVYSEIFEKNNKKIGYLYITIFAENTDEQFEKKLKELESKGIDSLIIDVRSNIGGHLTSVTNILNMFFDKEEVLYQRDKKGKIEKVYGNGKNKEYEVAVLIDQSSASASEILASAFKEISNSELIGMTTFGKGTVQQTVDLASGGMIKITTENWLTSAGNAINNVGVTPTIEISLSDEYKSNPNNDTDNQLQKAIEILSEK